MTSCYPQVLLYSITICSMTVLRYSDYSLQYSGMQLAVDRLEVWCLYDWCYVGPTDPWVTLLGARCLNPGGSLNIIKNRQNLDLLQIPPMGAPQPLGPPKSTICQLWYRFQVKKTIKMESQIEKIHVPLKL